MGAGAWGKQDDGGEHLFLAHPHGSGDALHFNAKLVDLEGKYIMRDVTTNGLAYQAGSRNGDQLIGLYAENIEHYSHQYIVRFLREEAEPILLLEFKRSQDGCTKFIWSRFELTYQDGFPAVTDVQVFETDKDVIPAVLIALPSISWLGNPTYAYDMYVNMSSPDPDIYLGIDNGKLQALSSYDKIKCSFLRYQFSSNEPPSKGTLAAYTKQTMAPTEPKATKNALAVSQTGKGNPVLVLQDFPSSIITRTSFKSDPRLWFERKTETGWILESMTKQGWFLSVNPQNKSVTLSKKPTKLMIAAQ